MARPINSLAALAAVALVSGNAPAPSRPAAVVSEDEARAIGVEAYIYLYPLVLMEVTRRLMTNVPPEGMIGRAPINAFGHQARFPPLNFRSVARPNYDTLYSWAWLDLAAEPMIVSVPDTKGRYYLLPMLDMWTDVFAVVGERTTGTGAGHYAVAAPGWHGRLPEGIARIDAPTPTVWLLGRIQTNGPDDYAAVHAVQAGFDVIALSQWGGERRRTPPPFDPSIDGKTAPVRRVAEMPAERFFSLGMALLRREGPHIVDQPILARMRSIGLDREVGFDFDALDPSRQKLLKRAALAALQLTFDRESSIGRESNGWRIDTDTMGVYGANYLKRAIIERTLPAANLPEDAIYPSTTVDHSGRPLHGANRYVIRFEKDQLPPVKAFWSITLYDTDGFVVGNPIDRYAIGDRDRLAAEVDGSVEIIVGSEDPGASKRSNWLPAPAAPFTLTMRLYSPERSVVDGVWLPPPVRRLPRFNEWRLENSKSGGN
jgi:hypothetical protein